MLVYSACKHIYFALLFTLNCWKIPFYMRTLNARLRLFPQVIYVWLTFTFQAILTLIQLLNFGYCYKTKLKYKRTPQVFTFMLYSPPRSVWLGIKTTCRSSQCSTKTDQLTHLSFPRTGRNLWCGTKGQNISDLLPMNLTGSSTTVWML